MAEGPVFFLKEIPMGKCRELVMDGVSYLVTKKGLRGQEGPI